MAVTESADAPAHEHPPDPAPPGRSVTVRASLVATGVTLLLLVAIVLGSRGLRDFDSALVPYTVATVFLTFGIAYRYACHHYAP